MNTVANENMVIVWAISPHFMNPLVRLTGLNSATMHWKNRMMTTPRMIGVADRVGTNERTRARTVQHCADDSSGKILLLCDVHPECNLRSVGIIRPRLYCAVRHDPGVLNWGRGVGKGIQDEVGLGEKDGRGSAL